jgi:hypothetical protein
MMVICISKTILYRLNLTSSLRKLMLAVALAQLVCNLMSLSKKKNRKKNRSIYLRKLNADLTKRRKMKMLTLRMNLKLLKSQWMISSLDKTSDLKLNHSKLRVYLTLLFLLLVLTESCIQLLYK